MQRKRTKTLEQRAAEYFGAQDEPRTSVKTSRLSCFLVFRRKASSISVAYYSEENPHLTKAEFWWLTEEKRKALVEALNG